MMISRWHQNGLTVGGSILLLRQCPWLWLPLQVWLWGGHFELQLLTCVSRHQCKWSLGNASFFLDLVPKDWYSPGFWTLASALVLTCLTGSPHDLQDLTLDDSSNSKAEWETHTVDCIGRRARLAQDSRTPCRKSGQPEGHQRHQELTWLFVVVLCIQESLRSWISHSPRELLASAFLMLFAADPKNKDWPVPQNLSIVCGAEVWASWISEGKMKLAFLLCQGQSSSVYFLYEEEVDISYSTLVPQSTGWATLVSHVAFFPGKQISLKPGVSALLALHTLPSFESFTPHPMWTHSISQSCQTHMWILPRALTEEQESSDQAKTSHLGQSRQTQIMYGLSGEQEPWRLCWAVMISWINTASLLSSSSILFIYDTQTYVIQKMYIWMVSTYRSETNTKTMAATSSLPVPL